MSQFNQETEDSVIRNSSPGYLYSHDFGDGRFFQCVHEESDENGIAFKVASKTLLKVIFLTKNGEIDGFEIVKLVSGGERQRIKLSKFNIAQIKAFLSFISLLDIGAVAERKLRLHNQDGGSHSSLLEQLTNLLGETASTNQLEEYLDKGLFLAKDLVNTGYRKLQLTKFQELLEEAVFWKTYCNEVGISDNSEEKAWQHFFNVNQWIFGYGLDYRFNSILQREAHISDTDLNGRSSVITDYLLGDKMFTTFVEIKKPSTSLFATAKNRSGSWRLSEDLTYSVSQILEQKATGQLKLDKEQYGPDGNRIIQKAYDSKVILIIGHWNEIDHAKNQQEKEIKKKTFELYRRDSRNIEMLTFDELYDRAKFIVEGSPEVDDVVEDDDLPF